MASLSTGKVIHEWDMTQLTEIQNANVKGELTYDYRNNVLNGIAYYKENDSFLITGKMWDFLFEVNL